MRLSIAFEDLLGSSIAPQVMPHCQGAIVCVILQKNNSSTQFAKKSRASQCRETRKVRLLPCEFVFMKLSIFC